jgi:crossover junction endodeoxyribonuclease RuvC
MRVLGIDPGLTRCGVGVVEGVPGRPCKLIAYYVVYTEPDDDIALRLLHLDRSLSDLVDEHRPQSVAVERVFSQHNVRTVMGTAQASAVAILAGSRARLPVQTYTPSEVKAAVTGSGTAGKAQVTAMVTRVLGLAAPPRPADAADALALAICHIWRGGTRDRIQAAAAGATRRAAIHRAAAARATPRTAGQQKPAAARATPRTAGQQKPAAARATPRPAGQSTSASRVIPAGESGPPGPGGTAHDGGNR